MEMSTLWQGFLDNVGLVILAFPLLFCTVCSLIAGITGGSAATQRQRQLRGQEEARRWQSDTVIPLPPPLV
ncbi:MAG TPA: hypothetical protein VFB21_20340 [Chthonomonadaceae bacterium]|nr:hypothetical protein [Chthonomonadaceae bacterium]